MNDYEDPCPVCAATEAEIDAFFSEKGIEESAETYHDGRSEPHNWLQDQGLTTKWLTDYRSRRNA